MTSTNLPSFYRSEEEIVQEYQTLGYIHLPVDPVDPGEFEMDMAGLHELLQSALQLEHATLPPYLTALYSIHPGAPWQVVEVIRSVLVEEMLHMVLVTNVLNAVGGTPKLAYAEFIPNYPDYLPYHVDDIQVSLLGFSKDAVRQAMDIERPKDIMPMKIQQGDPTDMTIGEFYGFIKSKLQTFVKKYGEERVFSGDLTHQIEPHIFYYDGGGKVVPVHDIDTAMKALDLIIHQGEGMHHSIWTNGEHSEVAHFFRFHELEKGQLYQPGDTYETGPTGETFDVPFDSAYPIAPNAKLADYPIGSEVRDHVVAFNQAYSALLCELEIAFNGHPERLLDAVPKMYTLKYAIERVFKNPFPGRPDLNAAPTFEFVEP